MSNFYENKILPHIINCGCSTRGVMKLRSKVVPLAFGEVLEVGMGSALNLTLYDTDKVEKVWGLEPSIGMREKAQANLQNSQVDVHWLDLPGEEIPLEDNSVDSVVLTYTLCTIPDWKKAMEQIHRVLKPQGKLIFCEHGRSNESSVQKWQDKLNSVWGKLFGGCNLNRPVIENITSSNFQIDWHEDRYLRLSPKFVAFTSYGVATKLSA